MVEDISVSSIGKRHTKRSRTVSRASAPSSSPLLLLSLVLSWLVLQLPRPTTLESPFQRPLSRSSGASPSSMLFPCSSSASLYRPTTHNSHKPAVPTRNTHPLSVGSKSPAFLSSQISSTQSSLFPSSRSPTPAHTLLRARSRL